MLNYIVKIWKPRFIFYEGCYFEESLRPRSAAHITGPAMFPGHNSKRRKTEKRVQRQRCKHTLSLSSQRMRQCTVEEALLCEHPLRTLMSVDAQIKTPSILHSTLDRRFYAPYSYTRSFTCFFRFTECWKNTTAPDAIFLFSLTDLSST